MKCGITGCASGANGLHSWGACLNVPLCECHALQLWGRIKGAVGAGLLDYTVVPAPATAANRGRFAGASLGDQYERDHAEMVAFEAALARETQIDIGG